MVFTAQSGGVQEGSLKIVSNDTDEPTVTVQLAGMWQEYSEQRPNGTQDEHPLGDFFKLFGYGTKATNSGELLSNGGRPEAVGDEVLSAYWQAADPTAPVVVRQLAAYHSQGNTETFKVFLKSNKAQTSLFTHNGLMGQSILPSLANSTLPAQGTLPTSVSSSVFGFKISSVWSDDSLNTQPDLVTGFAHFIRMYPALDFNRNPIPNQWLIAMDYYGINYDYQDNIYLVSNVRPASPAAPSNVVAETADTGVRVTWAKNTEFTASNYNIYRSDSPTGTFFKVNSSKVTGTEFVDLTAPGGVTSYYKITTADNWGGESGMSNVVSALGGNTNTPPSQPLGVSGTSRSDGVLIAWSSNIEVDLAGYRVYRSLTAGGTFELLSGSSLLTSTEFLDAEPAIGTTNFYKVTAVDTAGGESVMSAFVSGTKLPPPDAIPPDAPTGVNAVGQKNGIAVTWSANSEPDISGYRILRAISAGGPYTTLTTGQLISGTTFVDTTPVTAISYYYRIIAVDTSGNVSGQSSTASASRLFPDPIRINAAGPTFIDAQGRTWSSDNGFAGGAVSTGAYEVLGTTDDALYYTRRYGNFNYNLALPDGAYKVNLLFADPANTAAGKRKFDVFAENKQILDDFDIARNGGGKSAISKSFNLNVTGGELNLRFVNVLDSAIVSAIEVLPIGDVNAPAIPKKSTAAGSQAGIKLDWADNVESDLAGYNVYRGDDIDGNYTKITSSLVTVSEYLDTAAPMNATSYYRITSVDIWGNESSPVALGATRPPDLTPPAAPADVFGAGSLAGIALTWTANTESDLAGYSIYRQDVGTGQFFKLNAVALTTNSYNDPTAASDATTNYRVSALDQNGNESAFAQASAYRPPALPSGNGLKGEYYDNSNLTGLKLSRTDTNIDFTWSTGSPDASIGVDTFSIRWTGQIQALATESYTFTLHADDGVRMWVNGVLVIDKFTNAGSVTDHVSTPVLLTAGEKADIKIEYFENTGGAYVQLFWQSSTMAKTLVPMEALFS